MIAKMIVAALLVCAALIGYGTPPAAAAEWYEGGTLHRATVAQWQAANDRNRLATAADITARIIGAEKLQAAGGMPVLRKLSGDLETCVTKGTRGAPAVANSDVATFMAMCATMMGWPAR